MYAKKEGYLVKIERSFHYISLKSYEWLCEKTCEYVKNKDADQLCYSTV